MKNPLIPFLVVASLTLSSCKEDEAAKQWYARLKSRPSFRPLLGDRILGMNPSAHYTDLDF